LNYLKDPPQTLTLKTIFTLKAKKIATISDHNFVRGNLAFGKRVVKIFQNRVIRDKGEREKGHCSLNIFYFL
jgi:hypothetical protein